MNRALPAITALCAAAVLFAGAAAGKQESAARGRLDFVVHVTPASGRTEPARSLTIFLLTKSYREIGREAEERTPRPDLDAYIDGLTASKELKEWMKKHHTVTILGADFHNTLDADDLFRVPEFLDAYVKGNLLALTEGFPTDRSNAEELKRNPQKYEAVRKVYMEKLRKFLAARPQSKEEMDTPLEDKDASKPWALEEARWRERCHARALEMAQTDYFAAKTATDLDGRGAFEAAPGAYWLSSLDDEALGGELHLRWDVAVEVRAGGVTRLELSNLNAVGRGGGSGSGHFRAGSKGISQPVCVYCPAPPFTDKARSARYQGTVLLEITILPDGTTTDVRVSRGLGMGLDESAVEQVRHWRFQPVIGPGDRPVTVDLAVEVNFRLKP
jgi:TonB family protein